jgi:hypothetical protein
MPSLRSSDNAVTVTELIYRKSASDCRRHLYHPHMHAGMRRTKIEALVSRDIERYGRRYTVRAPPRCARRDVDRISLVVLPKRHLAHRGVAVYARAPAISTVHRRHSVDAQVPVRLPELQRLDLGRGEKKGRHHLRL